ncbi:MAG: (E)-4-hydroxy-3-methylbut-2-enyl-diphosphate synthase [Cephaloticoccus sp.]|nr:(E)-4-hydroxy-3-methylbut-2-enyl-diphosphate synthase [Cephaloticoccus sp.]MCF7760058.1 (E)-4-hydroxy-3-methylbut-2-enyl-diphosphate synthase [Cephaloticoccus sp.]
MPYCASRSHSVRRTTHEVRVGGVGVGGNNPVRIQSMTTSDTQDIAATVRQCIALAEVGCEIVRITAPNVTAAKCLQTIRAEFSAAGFSGVPLVADIHFLPTAAMEAVEHVEKIRVNPGNYADKKRFAVKEYTDAEYERELQRLHDSFSPLVKRARTLGRALRVGTNHGSLSDRIMNRYGDTPLGMVESALEFLHIAEAHGFKQTILSMKASNPKVMIQAYRLLVQRMAQEDMHYPLHLGVTEAGDGEDGRIKSAIGIGSLLLDGLGDTIRVSLTEDSVYEIPVARAIADKTMSLWENASKPRSTPDAIDPYHFTRRETNLLQLGGQVTIGSEHPPAVVVRIPSVSALPATQAQFAIVRLADTPVEGLLVPVTHGSELTGLNPTPGTFLVLELPAKLTVDELRAQPDAWPAGTVILRGFDRNDASTFADFVRFTREKNLLLAAQIQPADFPVLGETLRELGDRGLLFTLSATPADCGHALGGYRQLADALRTIGSRAPLWIRNTPGTAVAAKADFLSRLLEAAFLSGGLLCDGLGDMVSIETEPDAVRALKLTYNVLQGAGTRSSKTEFVACPSCGRTLFDLQATTQRIREKTGHLKGVKLAIMGCIVNGPGEMADADFGYVGGAPGKINLYVGKQCVQYNIPQAEADDHLIALIKAHGKWAEVTPA